MSAPPGRVALLLWACDPDDPVRLATPFFQASAAAAMDAEVEVYFTARSVLLLRPGVAEALYASADRRKSIHGYMQEAASFGARFYACTDALVAQGLRLDELIPEVAGAGGAVRFMDRALDPSWRTLVF
ncbi:MAG: DsrE family protein [Nitrospira sp.]|nr:DsrE family protein [Nitrospira sp.]